MVLQNSIDLTFPIAINNGGTNASSFSTSNGLVKYDGTRLVSSTGITLDASNNMLKTTQPCFCAYLTTSPANVTGNGVDYSIVFDTVVFDQTSSYNHTNGVFTAPVTGKYLLYAQAQLTGNFSGGQTKIDIVLTSRTAQPGPSTHSFVGNTPINAYIIGDMTAAHTVGVKVTVSGGSAVVGVQGDATLLYTYFCGYLLC